MAELAQRTIVVTGGAGGIGRECIPIFLAQGAKLLLVDPNEAGLAEVAAEFAGAGEITTVVSTLEDVAECRRVLAAVEGPLYGLVHLAGIFKKDLEGADDPTVWDVAISSNLKNAYDMAHVFVERADADVDSRMVFISSLAFNRGAPAHVPYSVAKGGITSLVRALSRKLAPAMLVNGLAPGLINTSMPAEILAERGDTVLREIPLGRLGHPRETATVIDFLLGPGSSYITGQIINVDGGIING
jgi:3-oxoacyl-[acyl-carrier protein] reductase